VQRAFGIHLDPSSLFKGIKVLFGMSSGQDVDIDTVQLTDLHVKRPLSLSDFNQNCIGWPDRVLSVIAYSLKFGKFLFSGC
jgi:hypothetical protein